MYVHVVHVCEVLLVSHIEIAAAQIACTYEYKCAFVTMVTKIWLAVNIHVRTCVHFRNIYMYMCVYIRGLFDNSAE